VAVKFAIYSTEKAASLNPWAYDPAPNVWIDLGEDPIWGEYDPYGGEVYRGSRIVTLGGSVDQDFGEYQASARITLSVQDSTLASATVTALRNAYAAVGVEYRFTDTLNCWKVRFAKPNGLKLYRNLYWKSAGSADVYSYELTFNVVSKDL
jgi:hypothetical protein